MKLHLSSKLCPYLIAIILLLAVTPHPAQSQPPDSLKMQQIDSLLTRVLQLKDIEAVYQSALENNYSFQSRLKDKEFIDTLTYLSNRFAFDNIYFAIKASLYYSLSINEVSALNNMATFNPSLIKKLIVDQSTTLSGFSQNIVGQLTGFSDSLIMEKNKKLFEILIEKNLEEMRNGTFIEVYTTGDTTKIVRNDSLGIQSETIGNHTFYAFINWISNNRYTLTNTADQYLGPEHRITLNIFELNGNEYSYIYRSPDNLFIKGKMIKISDDSQLPRSKQE